MKRVNDSHIHKSIKMFPPFFLKKSRDTNNWVKMCFTKKKLFPCCLSVFTGMSLSFSVRADMTCYGFAKKGVKNDARGNK